MGCFSMELEIRTHRLWADNHVRDRAKIKKPASVAMHRNANICSLLTYTRVQVMSSGIRCFVRRSS
jgi:hypothetical protein